MRFSFENLHCFKSRCILWPNSLDYLHINAQNFSSVTYFAIEKQKKMAERFTIIIFFLIMKGEN